MMKAKKAPALIIVSGSEGRIEKAREYAQLLSSRGYICLAIASLLWFRGLPQNLERIPLECLVEGERIFIRHHPQVDSEKIGNYGRSKGAEFVLAGEKPFDDVQCLVLNSPSDVVYEGIGEWNSSYFILDTFTKGTSLSKVSLRDYLFSKLFGKHILEDSSAKIDVSKLSSPFLLLGGMLMKYGMHHQQ